jgi:alpha-D-ribose 1-methylphosphonate 5-triphosphate synthase subunit PhnG
MIHESRAPSPHAQAARREQMGLCARAGRAELERGLAGLGALPAHTDLRRPEIGLVMLRGRTGGIGAPFNLGEATVARATVRLASGETGTACVLGRDGAKAKLAALVDALWQSPLQANVESQVLAPIRAALYARDNAEAGHTAATKVDFFTLVRGED